MASKSKEKGYMEGSEHLSGKGRVLGLGVVAAVSALAGGLTVAWWHRKTLEKLQNPIPQSETSIPEHIDSELESGDINGF